MVNTPLLQEVLQKITDFPELHDQGSFFTETDCGTACCFAGWACVLSGYRPVNYAGLPGFPGIRVEGRDGKLALTWDQARELLGLTQREASLMFSPATTRAMLEHMVKDLSNIGKLEDWHDYYDLVHQDPQPRNQFEAHRERRGHQRL